MRTLFVSAIAVFLLVLFTAGLALASPPTSSALQSAVQAAVAAVTPALVRIHVVEVEYDSGRETKSEAVGSGVIFDKAGYVITNHHVAGDASQISCTLATREEIDADLVGTDPLTDISVLKLRPATPREFPVARFGDSSALRVGDSVLAMGSPLALSQSVTLGIVSNTAMVMPDMFWPFKFQIEGEDVGSMVRWIGHDAAISPGNSGGPLVNLNGEVVGINEISFGLAGAIPGNQAVQVAEALVKHGKVQRAWLGLDVQPMLRSQEDEKGVLVSGSAAGSPAEKAGFQPGDILTSLNGQAVSVKVPEELPVFNQFLAGLPIDQEIEAVVQRGGKTVTLKVTPQAREGRRPRQREVEEWGLTVRDLTPALSRELQRKSMRGVLVTGIRTGGPADQAKPRLSEGDVIVEVAGTPVATVNDLQAATAKLIAGKPDPTPTLVGFDRKTERYLTVVKIGRGEVPEPDIEVRKAWLPVTTQVLTRDLAESLKLGDRTGVRITSVVAGSAAEKAGLKVGDIVVALDGQDIPASRQEQVDVFPAMIRQYQIGAQAKLTVLRDGKSLQVPVTFVESPRSSHECKRCRDNVFDFTVRDIAFEDRERQQWPDSQQGAYVDGVKEGGWAALAHLAVGDLLLDVDGKPTPDAAAVQSAMEQLEARKPKSVVLHVKRGIHDLFVELLPKWTNNNG